MANVSKLLYSAAGQDPSFFAELQIKQVERDELLAARRIIRECLRRAFAEATRVLGATVAPRFYTQGSFAYGTLNRAPFMPPQQMDLDDGVYLPLSFLKGAPKPSIAADQFFKVVDTALNDLAGKHGWKFIKKPTCARLEISDIAHVDTPMYAIPDEEFLRLEKAAVASFAESLTTDDAQELEFMRAKSDTWRALPADKVMLAHREKDWVQSDPRKIHSWFTDQVDLFGERFLRVCRYLKAWRDQHSALNSVSSIALMACAVKVYQDIDTRFLPARDDEAFAFVAARLPDLFRSGIENPTSSAVPKERLDRDITDADRKQIIAHCQTLKDRLAAVLNNCMNATIAVSTMRELLGERVPLRDDLVVIKAAAAAAVAAEKEIVPIPSVKRSQSG